MVSALENLEPRLLWEVFASICSIPHGSKHEGQLASYFEKLLRAHGCRVQRDDIGNLCAAVDPAPGFEHAPIVTLQAHLDMVCEKNEATRHDFRRDGIRLIRNGDWLKADGTTLGADNGIGVAAAAAIALSDAVRHGPLEILLTIDEESGLTGALHLPKDFIQGRFLINLDAENADSVCIGCAGGGGISSRLELVAEPPRKNLLWRTIRITGLRGGHSGINIHENRANSVKLMAQLLCALDDGMFVLADFHGGDKLNAIPREAHALIGIRESDQQKLQACITRMFERLKREYPEETGIEITDSLAEPPQQCFTDDAVRRLLNLLLAFPAGVLGMSRSMPNLVETSNNLSSAHIVGTCCVVQNMPRSSSDERLDDVIQQICAISALSGCRCERDPSYPGWEPNPHSVLLTLYENTYEALYGCKPIREAVHAGLECGIIGKKMPGMDMIAIGPDIRNCHSPDEAVHVASVYKFWSILTALLENIARAYD